jgi:peroxiredoxin Q/BCP
MKTRRSLRRQGHGFRNALVLVLLAVAAIAAIAYVGMGTNGGGSATLVVGDKAPQFALASVNGASFSLNSYLNKSDVLLFFNEGLTCSPCLQQMVNIDRNYTAFSKMGITVVSITTDSMSDMRTWSQNNGITKMMVLPDQSLQVDQEYGTLYAGSMHAGSAPGHTFILVGKDGNVLWRKDYGPDIMYVPMNELVASVKSALG